MNELLFAASVLGSFVVGGLGRRIAGGLLQQWVGPIGGSHVGRLVFGVMVGAMVALLAPVWWWGLCVVPAVWVGMTFGFPKCGMWPRNAQDVLAIAVRHGLLAVLPLFALLAGLMIWSGINPLWTLLIPIAGLLRGPFYWLATLWTPHMPALGLINLRSQGGPIDPVGWAEIWSGGFMGVAVLLAFWMT